MLQEYKKMFKIYSKVIFIFLCCFFLLWSCDYRQRGKKHDSSGIDSVPAHKKDTTANPVAPITVNIFIENSGSMDGYITGTTYYKDALTDLLVQLKFFYHEENIKINFICDDIFPANNEFTSQFVRNLSKNTPEWKQHKSSGSTNLNEIIKKILNNTHTNNISILISDCIYSISGNYTEGLLSQEKSLTKDAYLTKFRQMELITTVIQLQSDFTGKYWDKNNRPTFIPNKPRPYYLWIIGDHKSMDDLNSKIKFDKIKGFKNSLTMVKTDTALSPYHTILKCSYTKGRFRPIRSRSCKEYIHGIENIELPKNRNAGQVHFQFAMAVDLSSVPVDSAYKKNKNNYIVTGNYEIKDIAELKKKDLCPYDRNMIGPSSATHLIIFSAKTDALDDLTLALKNRIPQWVYTTDTNDDINIMNCLDKTFGFKYLIEGVDEAYKIISGSNDTYFTVNISIKKAAQSSAIKTIFIFIVLALIAAAIFILIKKLKDKKYE